MIERNDYGDIEISDTPAVSCRISWSYGVFAVFLVQMLLNQACRTEYGETLLIVDFAFLCCI